MSEFLLHYKRPDPATWVYLSSFLTIGLFFVFHRFWSIRNLDILLLIMLAPGLLMVYGGRRDAFHASELVAAVEGLEAGREEAAMLPPGETPLREVDDLVIASESQEMSVELPGTESPMVAPRGTMLENAERVRALSDQLELFGEHEAGNRLQLRGFIWLLGIEMLILLRLLLDSAMVRRPLLAPNLTTGGLFFIGGSLLVFLMANVVTSTARQQRELGPEMSPAGYPLIQALPALPIRADAYERLDAPITSELLASSEPPSISSSVLARVLVILAHIAVLVGIVLIGYRHFGNLRAGAGCALLYLLLPYTAQMTGRVDHVLPAAMLVWAVLFYRRPLVAGIFLGLAAGLVYYPLFLLPLWIGFYWQRGRKRFIGGVAITIGSLMLCLTLGGWSDLGDRVQQMFGLWLPRSENLLGVWGLGWFPIWRLPVLVAFLLLSGFYAVWPAQKNLGTLISCSAALMVASQFWHGYGGGMYIAWFLPLLLLTIFRPNLEDRVALKVIGGASVSSNRRISDSQIEAA
ncbi:hypothetical protein FF011L_06470 [Roseimaritima multifibrata]|uniref:Transmembrane protein n=1 Tax=Roseimaritima multifibrata TaxID=1930274 RepID=A0A517MAN0_9BACT|nr:DUF2029 domain-containing protein [Roseimaritima multifibrata]QDS91911.1 hypothetical protein FF011L_06470 [Roseimaritima multifibrata]